ncbi:uncharacterized protein LOC108734690 [Agrilus planipennis]|uniref:Uncharacterized protein LOC108734690 n=1 Tax=Agrilus planipennis TaxID=224129 RepID=A0A1W4WCZ6_AGRPL|nr:uncharacterized protein LOC108734690 [Agrilus planipennis]
MFKMSESENVLSEIIDQIAKENNIVKPKVVISDTTRGGYLGVPSTIIVEETGNGTTRKPLHLFLKSAPKNSRETLPIRDTFINEIVMYEEVLTEFLKFQKEKLVTDPFQSIVKCYRSSAIYDNEFLIFEDLTKSGFVLWDKTKPMTTKCVEFILKETAKYHALSFAFRDQKPDVFDDLARILHVNILTKFFETIPSLLKSYTTNMKCALNLFDPVQDKKIYEILANFIENGIESIVMGYSIEDNDKVVIIHGDSWCNNFMLKFEDPSQPDSLRQMKFLDWQCSRLSSPVIDMSYFLYCNGPQEVFDNLDYYLKLYHNTLASALSDLETDVEKVFPFSTLQNHWRKYARFGLTMACTLISIYYNPSHAVSLDITELSKDNKDVEEHFTSAEVQSNEMYRKRLGGIVTHFVNKGFI